MSTTSKAKSSNYSVPLSVKVTPALYEKIAMAAGAAKTGAWLRSFIEEHLERTPIAVVQLEEQLAANYIQEAILIQIATGSITVDSVKRIIAAAHRAKAKLAANAIAGTGGE